jgi:hypothetical protein
MGKCQLDKGSFLQKATGQGGEQETDLNKWLKNVSATVKFCRTCTVGDGYSVVQCTSRKMDSSYGVLTYTAYTVTSTGLVFFF